MNTVKTVPDPGSLVNNCEFLDDLVVWVELSG